MKSVRNVVFGVFVAFTLGFAPVVAEECQVVNLSVPKDPEKIAWDVWCVGTVLEAPAQGWSVKGEYCCLAHFAGLGYPMCKSEVAYGHEKLLEVRFFHSCPWLPLAYGRESWTSAPSIEPICWCCVGRWPCAGEKEDLTFQFQGGTSGPSAFPKCMHRARLV